MIKDFFKADEIRVALVAGFCIIALSVLFKKILHIEAESSLINSPSYLVIIYLITRSSKKMRTALDWKIWSLIIIAFSVIAVIVTVT
jgi:hypothetical protein